LWWLYNFRTEIATYNRKVNPGFDHLSIVCGAVEKTLPQLEQNLSTETVAIIDPPRAGLRRVVIDTLHQNPPRMLAYLSCNPETQVRDLKCFLDLGWKVEGVTPYDFFPRTHHIESLAMLLPSC
jgi:tRNA/tmRNA/rRNA uracil-C5-methylase (TrmA/RlmC/RlmD family)